MKKGLDAAVTGDKENKPVLKRGSSMEITPGFWDLPGGKMEKSKFREKQLKARRRKRT